MKIVLFYVNSVSCVGPTRQTGECPHHLMRKEVGDVATVRTPSGTREFEILAIEYKPIQGVEIISRV